jgi:hypothetical protein
VIVSLTNGSKWTVKGTCYLTSLSIDGTSKVMAPLGHTVSMTVGGAPTAIVPGNTYTGAIMLTIN